MGNFNKALFLFSFNWIMNERKYTRMHGKENIKSEQLSGWYTCVWERIKEIQSLKGKISLWLQEGLSECHFYSMLGRRKKTEVSHFYSYLTAPSKGVLGKLSRGNPQSISLFCCYNSNYDSCYCYELSPLTFIHSFLAFFFFYFANDFLIVRKILPRIF